MNCTFFLEFCNSNHCVSFWFTAIVSFTNVSSVHKKEAEELGVSCFSWEEFYQLVLYVFLSTIYCLIISTIAASLFFFFFLTLLQGSLDCELPSKQKTNICTIMYTSGTTGEPKGVILNNAAIMAEVLSVDHLLLLTDKVVSSQI